MEWWLGLWILWIVWIHGNARGGGGGKEENGIDGGDDDDDDVMRVDGGDLGWGGGFKKNFFLIKHECS